MKKLYIIRHGESLDDIDDRYGGYANYPLTEKGIEQAHELAVHLQEKESSISKLYTSPYMRAWDTAKILAEALNVELEVRSEIRERNTYGYLSGMRQEIGKTMFPEDHARTKVAEEADEIDGAEKVSEVVARVTPFIEELKSSEEDVVAMVVHNKETDILFRYVLGMKDFGYKSGDCGYFVVSFEGENSEVVEMHKEKAL